MSRFFDMTPDALQCGAEDAHDRRQIERLPAEQFDTTSHAQRTARSRDGLRTNRRSKR